MSGLYCTILLKKPFDVNDTGWLTKLLKAISSDVVESRKGLHWDFAVEHCASTLNITHTSDRSCDYEDIYQQLAITFEDAPDAIELAFGCRRECDEVACDKIRNALLAEFDAIDCGTRY
ncbi:hypothetical protein [Aeoliella sp. SH292]|uniref:hypothetical protein n=1 Tax=Aeoliella sp. SH292 TaxID=3454464 RepID=UPI003F9DD862